MTIDLLTEFLRNAYRYESHTQNIRNRLLTSPIDYKAAAVLLAIVRQDHQWQFLLTRRTHSLRHHTGQIALAGGRREANDANDTQTALRETWEETGIEAHHWQTFPALPPHFTPSGYEVHPIPALCTTLPYTQANPDEVAEIFYVPFDFAMSPANYQTRTLQHQGQTIDTPALPFRHYDIWGLTAIILYGLAERYQQHLKAI